MSPVTASVLIGTNHPNEANVEATHLALLREHFRASWHLHDLNGDQPEGILAVGDPSQVLDSLFLAIGEWVVRPAWGGSLPVVTVDEPERPRREYRDLALVVATYRDSGLHPYLPELRELTETAITVAERSWQRHWSMWSEVWEVDDGNEKSAPADHLAERRPLP